MDNPGLVSIITPTYQREKLLRETIESALDQTYRNFEMWIVDDGSTDGTAELVKNFQQKDKRIQYHYQKNQGPAAARNKAMELSHGEFIAMLDSDELWMSRKLERQIETFEKQPQIDFQYCNGYFLNASGSQDAKLTERYKPTIQTTPEDMLFQKFSFFSTSGIIFRRKCLVTAGLFDTSLKLMEDVDLWFRILLHHRGYFLNEELVANRKHPQNYARTMIANLEIERSRSLLQMRHKAVALYERKVRRLTRSQRSEALDRYHVDYIKECFAQGDPTEARTQTLSYWKDHKWSPRIPFFLALSLLPKGILTSMIRWRRGLES